MSKTKTKNQTLTGRFELHNGRLVLIPDADRQTGQFDGLYAGGCFFEWRGSLGHDENPYVPAGMLVFRPDGEGRFFLAQVINPQLLFPKPFSCCPARHSPQA